MPALPLFSYTTSLLIVTMASSSGRLDRTQDLRKAWNNGGMPETPKPSADDLVQMLFQLEAAVTDAQMRQILDRLGQQTFVGGKRVAIEKLPRLPKQAATSVHRVKVSLYGARPPIWRRLEIPSAMRLDLVHEIIQVAFDWYGYHLHMFETVCGQFGAPDDDDDWPDRKDEATAALAQVAAAEKAKVVYAYDFGDDWRHDIVVEKIAPAEPGVAYPRCTGGRRSAPPEDCGGIWAFNEFPAALDDTFDADEMTARLAGLAKVLIPAS
jgi:Plasmid pRiA4b ORF-3-like protein